MSRDLVARVGTYQDAQGKDKGEFQKIGVILSNDNGEYALIDPAVNLAGVLIKQRLDNPQKAGGMVMCGIYDRDNNQQNNNQAQQHQQQQAQTQQQAPANANTGAFEEFNDSIPF